MCTAPRTEDRKDCAVAPHTKDSEEKEGRTHRVRAPYFDKQRKRPIPGRLVTVLLLSMPMMARCARRRGGERYLFGVMTSRHGCE
ncbi:hypothetical protein PC116_g23080 [Phytophthora cactorum]|nr:hypothetical protein PC116_g23080 [Phytophthora cactorum]